MGPHGQKEIKAANGIWPCDYLHNQMTSPCVTCTDALFASGKCKRFSHLFSCENGLTCTPFSYIIYISKFSHHERNQITINYTGFISFALVNDISCMLMCCNHHLLLCRICSVPKCNCRFDAPPRSYCLLVAIIMMPMYWPCKSWSCSVISYRALCCHPTLKCNLKNPWMCF